MWKVSLEFSLVSLKNKRIFWSVVSIFLVGLSGSTKFKSAINSHSRQVHKEYRKNREKGSWELMYRNVNYTFELQIAALKKTTSKIHHKRKPIKLCCILINVTISSQHQEITRIFLRISELSIFSTNI